MRRRASHAHHRPSARRTSTEEMPEEVHGRSSRAASREQKTPTPATAPPARGPHSHPSLQGTPLAGRAAGRDAESAELVSDGSRVTAARKTGTRAQEDTWELHLPRASQTEGLITANTEQTQRNDVAQQPESSSQASGRGNQLLPQQRPPHAETQTRKCPGSSHWRHSAAR